jgi:multisubunit Na+/H+ antiporter MnhG subunit
MRDLLQVAPTIHTAPLLKGTIAVLCPTCHVRLRVRQGALVVATFGLFVAFVALLAATRSSPSFWIVAVLFLITFMLLQSSLVVWLLRLSVADTGFRPTSAVVAKLETSDEVEIRLKQAGPGIQPWRCGRCGGSNDVIFAICTHCDSRRWSSA